MKKKITLIIIIIVLLTTIFIFYHKNKSISVITAGNAYVTNKILADSYIIDENNYNFNKLLKNMKDYIKKYDLKFYSQSSPIKSSKYKISGDICSNTPLTFATEMIHTGFNLVNLATKYTTEGELELNEETNNYYCKYYDGIVEESINFWKLYNNVYSTGSYSSKEERNNIKILEKNDIKYTLLSYTASKDIEVNDNKQYYVNLYDKEQVKKDIEQVKDKVDAILVSISWDEYENNIPNDFQKQEASYLASLGVDVIIGHGTKVIQPIEKINDTLVIYSLGDFVPNYKNKEINEGIGQLVSFKIEKKNNKINITNVSSELIYQYYDSNYSNNLIIPFSQMTTEYNEEYLNLYNKYNKIVKLYDENITVKKPNEKGNIINNNIFTNSSDRKFTLLTKSDLEQIKLECNNQYKSLLTSIQTILSGYNVKKSINQLTNDDCSINICETFNNNYINCSEKETLTNEEIIKTIQTHKQIIIQVKETSHFKEEHYITILDYKKDKGIFVSDIFNNEEYNSWIDLKEIENSIIKSYITF